MQTERVERQEEETFMQTVRSESKCSDRVRRVPQKLWDNSVLGCGM